MQTSGGYPPSPKWEGLNKRFFDLSTMTCSLRSPSSKKRPSACAALGQVPEKAWMIAFQTCPTLDAKYLKVIVDQEKIEISVKNKT